MGLCSRQILEHNWIAIKKKIIGQDEIENGVYHWPHAMEGVGFAQAHALRGMGSHSRPRVQIVRGEVHAALPINYSSAAPNLPMMLGSPR